MSKARLAYDTLHSIAAQLGAIIVEEGHTGSCHRFAVLDVNGRRGKVFYASTPSDRRGHLNMKCDVRKVVNKLRAEA